MTYESRYDRTKPSNENKMSDGGRGRASLGVEGWKSSQKWRAPRSAVRSIAWLDRWATSEIASYDRCIVSACLAATRARSPTMDSTSLQNSLRIRRKFRPSDNDTPAYWRRSDPAWQISSMASRDRLSRRGNDLRKTPRTQQRRCFAISLSTRRFTDHATR